jgi:hypothetical protein
MPEEQLKIVSLQIDNVKRLHAVHIEPDGSAVIVGGRNAQGKTSVLDAITMALSGSKCERPVHGDETKGKVVIDLGEIVVTRTFTQAGGGALTVAAANGAKFSSPQTMLDSMLGKISFDPLEFTRMKPADQLATLREICGVSTAMIDSSRANAFDERTSVNRRVKELEAQVAGMPFHADAPAETQSAADITADLKEANAKNDARDEFIREGKAKADALKELDNNLDAIGLQIEELKAQKEKVHVARGKCFDELDQMRARAATMDEIDTAPLAAKLDNLAGLNAKVFENQRRAEYEAKLKAEREKAASLTKKIEDLDARKRAKLEEANYPVTGLALTDAGIEFNGIPFEQSSSAEQLKVSVAIGIAMNPRVRVLLVRDGSLLDDESLAMMRAMADEKGAQLWIERVGKGDECTVVIEDGRIENALRSATAADDAQIGGQP